MDMEDRLHTLEQGVLNLVAFEHVTEVLTRALIATHPDPTELSRHFHAGLHHLRDQLADAAFDSSTSVPASQEIQRAVMAYGTRTLADLRKAGA